MTRRPAQVAVLATAVALALSGASPAAAVGKGTGAGHASACRPASVAATLNLADTGSSSPAGAVIFRDLSKAACTLEGVPAVTAKAAGGSPVDVYEESVPHHEAPALLTPGRSGKVAAASITWSSWGCAQGSYSLGVRFSGWASGLTVPSGKSAATAPTCSETGQTVYVGAVAPYKGRLP